MEISGNHASKKMYFVHMSFLFWCIAARFQAGYSTEQNIMSPLVKYMMHMILIFIYYNIYVHISHHIPGTSLFIKYQYHQYFMTQALTLLVDLHVGKRRKHQESATTLGSFEALPAAASQV